MYKRSYRTEHRYISGTINMRTGIVICLFVGIAFATNLKTENAEYIYTVNGRTLSALHHVANQFSGVLYSAKLKIQPKSQEKWLCQIFDAQVSRVHAYLEKGWTSDIPDAPFKPLAITTKPFEVILKSGVITDLIVSKDVKNWESNMIKGIMSQFQLDIKATEYISSRMNTFSDDESKPSAVFKTMEETVTGNTETMYEIHPIPRYALQTRFNTLNIEDNQNAFEVIKHKNYTNNEELPLYSFGFGDVKYWKPATNQMGDFFKRSTFSRAILTGNVDRHVLRNSSTVNKIIVKPTLKDQQSGMVVSAVRVTLEKIAAPSRQIEEVSEPMRLGNLVYSYNADNTGRSWEKKSRPLRQQQLEKNLSPEDLQRMTMLRHRQRRSSDIESSMESGEYYQKDQPNINEAPESPLLPYTTGYNGSPLKKGVDVINSVEKLSMEIGSDLSQPQQIYDYDTMNKFTILTSLLRTMSTDEIEKAAGKLYTQSKDQTKWAAWRVFRDAVAECGTGPALVAIQNWIVSQKISGHEASHIVSTMSRATREPTLEYLQHYFEMVKSPVVKRQWPLNDTVILNFATLLRKSIVNKELSARQYPVNSFGKFSTEEGRQFVKDTVLPYFAEKLNTAIAQSETRKIHAYIRAIGNIGHPKLLAVFEPYLQGEKKASDFQRILMVIAMDKLIPVYPEVVRTVLFKIYQNPGDSQEVRIAALLNLFKTSPPTDMLQLIAANTHVDSHEHVNAAAKSLIEEATKLTKPEWLKTREAAIAAQPLLTKKTYGIQYGQFLLRQYIYENLEASYKDSLFVFGSEDSLLPKGGRLSLRENVNGIRHRYFSLQGLVTSIEELLHVGQEQFEYFQQEQKQQEQNANEQAKNPWSSKHIARLLNMRSDEMEQLEGFLYLEWGTPFRMLAFDNRTIEQLPEFLSEIENELRKGQEYNYVKLMNHQERAISFPTEMGFPFLFTYDTPTLIKVEGKVKATASPKIAENGQLRKPEKIELRTNLSFTVHSKIQGRFSFVTPFDHHQYVSGYDKHFQAHIPVHGDIEVDVKKMQLTTEFEMIETHKNAKLLHYSTHPYTSVVDIMHLQPLARQSGTKIIKKYNMGSFERTVGIKSTGIAFRVNMEHERNFINTPVFTDILKRKSLSEVLLNLWNDDSIQFSKINVWVDPKQTTTRTIQFGFGYQTKYAPEFQPQNPSKYYKQFATAKDSWTRQEIVMEKVATGIKNVEARAYDAYVKFQGANQFEYVATAGFARSSIDPKSIFVLYFKKHGDNQAFKPYGLSFRANNVAPNTNGLDLEYSMQAEPKIESTWRLYFGESDETLSNIKSHMTFRRSHERKEYLKQLPAYKQCQKEMREGNKQLHSCVNITMESNLLDRVEANVEYESLPEVFEETVGVLFDYARVNYFWNIEQLRSEETNEPSKLIMRARFDSDLRSVNVSVAKQGVNTTMNNIPVNPWAQKVFVQHPVFQLPARLMAQARHSYTYKPVCIVDKTKTSTFNNRTYQADISKHWTVMFQYVPTEARREDRFRSVEEQIYSQPENYAVLVRSNRQNQEEKELKITLSTPTTHFKVVDITMMPKQGSSGSKVEVKVNDKKISVSDEKTWDMYGNYIQIYALPNNEVKFEVRGKFYIIYDGERVRLATLDGRFRNSVRGLCGQHNDEPTEDLLTSQNCYARDLKKFVKSYEVEGQEGKSVRDTLRGDRNECPEKPAIIYPNVVSYANTQDNYMCSYFQTRYVEENGHICFTTRPVITCHRNCEPRGALAKDVPVHCIPKTNVAQLWKTQIQKGASPDFSQKEVTKTIVMQLPKTCSRQ